jgi:hypothetical protein
LEKQREKAERRAQRKLASRKQSEFPEDSTIPAGDEASIENVAVPSNPEPQN